MLAKASIRLMLFHPLSQQLRVWARRPDSKFQNLSFLRNEIVVCCSNALRHYRKPPWPSVPASPVRQPSSARSKEEPTSFVEDWPRNEGENFPPRKALKIQKPGKESRRGGASPLRSPLRSRACPEMAPQPPRRTR